MKKIFIPVLCAVLAFSASSVSAKHLSDWAVPEYEAANTAGLIPTSIVSHRLTDRITRVEFCEAVMNLYKIIEGVPPKILDNPFTDTDNESILAAYSLGVVNGKTPTAFYPDDPITRQEMAKMVMRTINAADKDAHITMEEFEKLIRFDDFGDTDDWAAADIAKSVKYKIINGVSENQLLPKGTATREQAIAIINRAFEVFCDNKVFYTQPEITDLHDGMTLSDRFAFTWSKIDNAKEYVVVVKDAAHFHAYSNATTANSIDLTSANLPYNKEYNILVGARISDEIVVFSDSVDVYYGTDKENINVITSLEGRYKRVFPNGVPFTTKAEADYNMTNIKIPVWKLGQNGEKYSSTMYLTVNRNLADEVVKIFNEIYHAPEKFPIKDVGGYSFRQTAFGSVSQHSYGTCIDINFDENYYCYPSGQAIVGSFWKPYENPYSIPADGSVVKAFSKYGWTWGGNWKNLRDYMHFSYLGK